MTPDLSYELEGEREEKMCEDNEWNGKINKIKNKKYRNKKKEEGARYNKITRSRPSI